MKYNQQYKVYLNELFGAAVGALSGMHADSKRRQLLMKLRQDLPKCQTPECKEKITNLISKYEEQTQQGPYASAIKRGIGGALTTSIGAGAYHLYDARKRRQDIKSAQNALR